MTLRIASLAAVVLASSVACGSSARTVAPTTATWRSIAPTLSGPLQPGSANACNRGTPACVEAVIGEMQARFAALAATCDHASAFALMYLRVTQSVHRTTHDAYLAHLDAVFAQLYFRAYDLWRAHRTVPGAWRVAFEATERGRVTGVGDLLLGMNAHISRDLPFAVAAVGLGSGPDRAHRISAFDDVNGILEAVAGPMLREETRRFDPTIARFTLPVLRTSSGNLGRLLGQWRHAALRDGRRLLEAPTPAKRAAVARTIERNALTRAVVIAAATARVPFSSAGRARDARCRATER